MLDPQRQNARHAAGPVDLHPKDKSVTEMQRRTESAAANLSEICQSLLTRGRELAELVDGPARLLIEEGLSVLNKQVCRIAVVGQVKAGKSSFVNALVRQPGLLPTHVNPSTTAVTTLHFSQTPSPDRCAARFTFFSKEEWQHLGTGSGKLRELTEQLVPGFEKELLVRNLNNMRQQSANRHGAQLDQLLGTVHTFANFEPRVLDRYVCAGNAGSPDPDSVNTGQYSDIVKNADIYFAGGPFSFPTTVIDTPGVNDPLLIRDEITRQTLDSADVYVVVLSALQPLSNADVALLRLLRGLHKERIIVFINRVDQLTQLSYDLAAIKMQVRNGLHREFPGVKIPIVTGSALWASQGLAIDRVETSTVLSERLEQFAEHHAARGLRETLEAARRGGIGAAELGRTIYECSGMPNFIAQLDQLVARSRPAHVIRHVAANFAELVRIGEMTTRLELRRIEERMSDIESNSHMRQEELDKLQTDARLVRSLSEGLEAIISGLGTLLQEIVEGGTLQLKTALQDAIDDFVAQERASLGEFLQQGQKIRTWRTDPTEIRQLLEVLFMELSRTMSARINDAEGDLFALINDITTRLFPQPRRAEASRSRPPPAPLASLGALSRQMTFDLGHPWWKAWWASPLSDAERLETFDCAIRIEFTRVADELVEAALRHHEEQVSTGLREAKSIGMSVVHSLRTHYEWNLARAEELRLALADGGQVGEVEPSGARVVQIRAMLPKWQYLNEQLLDLQGQSEHLVG